MSRRKTNSLLKNNKLGVLGIAAAVILFPFALILISTGFRNAVIGLIADILNALVLSNIFFCNLVVIGILTLAILVVIYIYSKIK